MSGNLDAKGAALTRRLLPLREVGERLGIPEASLRKRLHSLGLPIYRLGRSVRVDSEELETWIREHRQAPAALHLVTPTGEVRL